MIAMVYEVPLVTRSELSVQRDLGRLSFTGGTMPLTLFSTGALVICHSDDATTRHGTREVQGSARLLMRPPVPIHAQASAGIRSSMDSGSERLLLWQQGSSAISSKALGTWQDKKKRGCFIDKLLLQAKVNTDYDSLFKLFGLAGLSPHQALNQERTLCLWLRK